MKKNVINIYDKYNLNPEITRHILKRNGFYYDYSNKFYTAHFDIYKNIFCLVINIDIDEKWIGYQVINSDHGNIYSSYYYREFGKDDVLRKMDREIKNVLNALENKHILQKKGTKRNE